MKTFASVVLSFVATSAVVAAAVVPERVSCAIADKQSFQDPDRVQLTGWVGSRITGNERNRLMKIDTARLLEGYRKRPGRQSWDGEHVGKWLHAATLAWVNTGDAALREKLDATVAELMKCQLDDGYLGTYLEKDRWTEWDVWAHKYNLIGLITYMRYTGNVKPLPTCTRMANLLCRTFGDEPGKRDLIKAGQHVGMAPTSVLEPMVWLYRLTGEQRYADFSKYILRSWEQTNGPHIISTLLDAKRVDKVGNGKAYEMLSCLNGALEYYRTFGGDRQILDACLNAWQDIVDKRLYLTGAASHHERFHDDFNLPNVANVGETCVTTTWIQFNAHLLRLTGEARFAEQLERVVLNQLFGAQKPDCTGWGYYVQMEGRKPYSTTLDGHCCLSSGPRGVALIPSFALSTDAEGAVVNLYDSGVAELSLRSGATVLLELATKFPSGGKVQITVTPSKEEFFALKLRIPAWSSESVLRLNGDRMTPSLGRDGYAWIQRTWKRGDRVELQLSMEPRLIVGDHLNAGKVAFTYGPLVLAADEATIANPIKSLSSLVIGSTNLATLNVTPEPQGDLRAFRVKAQARRGGTAEVRLVSFADAGGSGSRYKVWLPLPSQPGGNALLDGNETRSRPGNLSGSIIDDDNDSIVVTFDGSAASEDWFAVMLDEATTIRRVEFRHGKTFHDGGWFDASAGKPKVQVQRVKGAAWETVGELKDYPATTATGSAKLKAGHSFTLKLETPIAAVALRVIGKPASGDNSRQAFASCAELQAFAE